MTRYALSLTLVTLLCIALPLANADEDGYATYRSESSFEAVIDGLRAAIEERGFYINNVMDIGGMLERTGKDLGAEKPIFTQARSVEFCSATLSRAMTQENPARIVNCPFIISVYQRAEETDATYLAHRTFPAAEQASSPAMAEVAAMLEGIAESALAW